jgi:alpha-ribazole phosphatase
MELYLVRHTSVAVPMGTFYGRSDVVLAESFEEEAAAVLGKLPQNPDAVYTSPLSRCRKLAEKIAPSLLEDARLLELGFGDWEMRHWKDIPKEELSPWFADYVNQACPGGETYGELMARASGFYDQIRLNGHKTAVVVTHGGVVRAVLVHLLGMPGNRAYTLNVDFGGVTRVACGKDGASVRYVNR